MKKIFFGVAIVLLALFFVDELVLKNEAEPDNLPSGIETGTTIEGDNSSETIAGEPDYGLQVGQKAPDFTLETLSGENLSLNDSGGKPVLLNFWATWCPPCKEEMLHMQNVYEKYSDRMEIIAVNLTFGKESPEKVQAFVEEYGLTFPIPLDYRGQVMDSYQIIPIPTSYFINGDGVIHSKYIGPMNERYIINQLEEMENLQP